MLNNKVLQGKTYTSSDLLIMQEEIIFFHEMKEYEKSLQKAEIYLKAKPDGHVVWNIKALNLQQLKQYPLAIEAFRKAIDHSDYNLATAYYYLNLAEAYKRNNQFEDSAESYQKAVEISEGDRELEEKLLKIFMSSRTSSTGYELLSKLKQSTQNLSQYYALLTVSPNYDSNITLKSDNEIKTESPSNVAGVILPIVFYQQAPLVLTPKSNTFLKNTIYYNKNLNLNLTNNNFFDVSFELTHEFINTSRRKFNLSYKVRKYYSKVTNKRVRGMFYDNVFTPQYTMNLEYDRTLVFSLPISIRRYTFGFSTKEKNQDGYKIEPRVFLQHNIDEIEHDTSLSYGIVRTEGDLYKLWKLNFTNKFTSSLDYEDLNGYLDANFTYTEYYERAPLRKDFQTELAAGIYRSWNITGSQDITGTFYVRWFRNNSNSADNQFSKWVLGTSATYTL